MQLEKMKMINRVIGHSTVYTCSVIYLMDDLFCPNLYEKCSMSFISKQGKNGKSV